jgi:aspartate/methionine/tyrosine aminotransferase
MTRLMINSNSCTATFTQIAGIEALTGDQSAVEAMGHEFQQRCALVVQRLNQIPGFSCRMPHGAFYAFPNITGTGRTSQDLANALLEEAGVAVLSGAAFGQFGEGYLRFSVANSTENLNLALDRIEEWTRKNARR